MVSSIARGQDRDREQRLQHQVDDVARRRHIPHVVLTLEAGDRSFRWSGAAGEATPDGAPMTAETPFFIASIDKTFTATVVLQLHEERVLALDDPMTRHLPAAELRGLHRLGGADHTSHITIRNLLGHTSGLPDYLEDYPHRGVSLIQRLFREEDRTLPLETVLRTVRDELTPHFPPQPAARADAAGAQPRDDRRLRRGPGRHRARYSDTNYQLLAAIVEAVSGRPLHEVTAERIFRPLGLRHTWYAGEAPPAEPPPPPAALWVEDRPLDRPLLLRSLRSIYSTTADLITFLRALTRGELFRDPATLHLMQERWNRFGLPRDRGALRAPGWPIEYAHGLMRFRVPRLFAPFAPVPLLVGHTGSTGTWLFHAPELDVFIAGAVNQAAAGAVPFRLVPKVLRALQR
jgi:D-alanyl-D-alanine carboxypeptidase